MALYLIGIGLADEKDISLKGLEAIKKCKCVYLENYTSVLQCSREELEKLYGKAVQLADRKFVEESDVFYNQAKENDVALLIIGDPLLATTHTEILLQAKERDIPVTVIHNASILSAVGLTGLQLYKFGKTASIPLENKNIETPYDVLQGNHANGMHTLFLLDLQDENFLTIPDAIQYLLSIEEKRKKNLITKDTLCIGCARLGSENIIKVGKAIELLNEDFGKPPYCLIIPGNLHFKEEEFLQQFRI